MKDSVNGDRRGEEIISDIKQYISKQVSVSCLVFFLYVSEEDGFCTLNCDREGILSTVV